MFLQENYLIGSVYLDEDEETHNAMDELLRFIAALRIKQMLTKSEADALEELLFENRFGYISFQIIIRN